MRGVARRYEVGDSVVTALEGVDLDIEAGEFVVVLGPSGSGKTTLLNMIGALDTPTEGEVRVAGSTITDAPRRELFRVRRRSVSFVFQTFNLFPALTARENVQFAADVAQPGPDAPTPEEVLDRVGLADRLDHFPHQLSGGEQQRVAVARALVNRPRLVIGDEPTGNLDSARTAEVLALLRGLNRDSGHTFLIVTHDAEVGAAADRIIRMRDGCIVSHGRDPRRPSSDAA